MRMNENELTKKTLWTNRGGQRARGRPISRWTDGVEEDAMKLVVEIGWRLPRTEVAGDISLRRPRPNQGCRTDDDGGRVFGSDIFHSFRGIYRNVVLTL